MKLQAYHPRQVSTVIMCGAMSSVGRQGSTLAVEREWVKAMCAGDSMLLARKNSGKPLFRTC